MPVEFPVLNNCTYLNTAYVGLMPQQLLDFRAKEEARYLQIGDLYKLNAYDKLPDFHHNLGNFLGADPKYCYMVPNFSEGIRRIFDQIPRDYKFLSLQGDYHSLEGALEEYGFDVQQVAMSHNTESELRDHLREAPYQVLVLSIVQYISGLKIDLDTLTEIRQEFPDLMIIGDATQFLGTADFDLHHSPFDAVVGSGYKWLLAGFGNGFCALKSTFFQKTQIKPEILEKRIYAGHFDILAAASLDFSIRQLLSEEVAEQRYRSIKALTQTFHQALIEKEWLHYPELSKRNPSSIFLIKGGQQTYDLLQQENIRCALRGDGVRISIHFYNSTNDLDHLMETLKKVPHPSVQTAT